MRYMTWILLCLCALTLRVSADDARAPASPPGALLASPLVAVDTAAQDRIVLLNPVTGARRELSFGRAWQRVWDFSPDGCRLLVSLHDGAAPGRLISARLDGSDVRDLVQADANGGAWEGAWSPLGDRVAFIWARGSGDARTRHVAVVTLDPTPSAPILYSVSGDEHTPRWSPDGRWIAYSSYDRTTDGGRESDLWIVSYDGTTKYRLTNFPYGSATMPRWSPTDEVIGFVYSPAPNSDQAWLIGNAPDAAPTQLTYGTALILDLTWQPDGASLIAAARDLGGVRSNVLWRLPLVGAADAQATRALPDDTLTHQDYPRYSADGRFLALRSAYGLAIVDREGGTILRDDAAAGNSPPVWSPGAFAGEGACG